MPRTLKAAAIQMEVTPQPVPQRLDRAAHLVAQAAQAGAQLVVLPEVFNTGYEYSDANFALAERIDGPTVTWMKAQAAQHGIHLAGSLLLLDEEDIYNAALLIAPDGRTWRYDKNYPWAWERAYFREGRQITIADTDLGKIGLMICWDYVHADLWERYAGKVDALVIISSPPRINTGNLVFPDGLRVNIAELGPALAYMMPPGLHLFGEDLDQHAAWMRVPVINTMGGGRFCSKVPMAALSLAATAATRPDLWARIEQAEDVNLEADFDRETKIVAASGQVLARVTDSGDGYTLAEATLADAPPAPGYDQPESAMNWAGRLFCDGIVPAVIIPYYRQGVRRQWGAHMAPVDPRTRLWMGAVLAGTVAGWLAGRFSRPQDKITHNQT